MHALKTELGLPADAPLVDAVREANAAVGLGAHGSLAEQVGRLLRETGIKVVAGAAGGAAPTPTPPRSPRPGSGSPRPPSRSAGSMTTQTQPATSFYERFLEQKRRDGVA